MADATARYVIAADDKTQSAIQSVMRNFKGLEKGVKATAQVLNASLGFFAGAKLAQSFKAVFRATAESEAGQKGFAQALAGTKLAFEQLMIGESGLPAATKSMEELQTILKDPGIIAAADALTGALISGFSKATVAIAQTIGGIRELLVQAGFVEAQGQQEIIDRLDVQIADIRSKIARKERHLEFSGGRSRQQIQAEVDELKKQEQALLDAQQKVIDKPPPLPAEKKTGEQLEAEREREKKAKEQAKKVADAFKKESDDIADYTRTMSRESAEIIEADYKDTEATRKESEEARARDAERVRQANEELAQYQRELRDEEAAEEEQRLKERVTVFTDAFKSAYDDIIRTGKFSARSFVEFLIAEFARKQLFKQIDAIGDALNRALNPRASGGGGGGGRGFLSDLLGGLGGLFGGGGTSKIGAGISAGANAAVFEQIGSTPLLKMQHGGSFEVGGSGGTDSQLVAFRATPGENVHVTTQGSGGNGAPSVVINNNIDARGATQDAVAALPAILERNNAALETKIIEGLRHRKYAI